MTAQESFQRLIAGNKRFVAGKPLHQLQDQKRVNALKDGQKPFAIILGCSDSRVVPEIAFDTGLGELFVIRVAGNVANASSIASIEHAVITFGTPLIMVLAHQNCGAVTAAILGGDNGEYLNQLLLNHVVPAIEESDSKVVDVVARANANLTAANLLKKSLIINDAVQQKRVEIHAAFYQLTDGKIVFLD